VFKNLRTSTKLVILCGMFVISVGVTTYSLVTEKQIAIEFARKELVGSRYLAVVRGVYATVLAGRPIDASAAPPSPQTDDILQTLAESVRPLERLENVASTVRETKDYSLRIDYTSKNEIGQLTASFNDMLSELAAARERERSEQSELARVARLTSMGALTASIAHEINQPLAAIVANSNAAQRWLSNASPNLDEARTVLNDIVRDGHRASKIIGSVRAMFQKDSLKRDQLAVNDLIEDILTLVRGTIRKQQVSIRTELLQDLPHVVADRTQLQQVFINLIMNAVEAMGAVTNRERLLSIKSDVHDPGTVMIMVEDSGTGIDPNNTERIFDAFFTTKSDGMGMGLAMCRSIIEAHGGRLWASPGASYGSVFHVLLPSSE
jgi:C4-dicarboxylate-specific signal transduction histidine kinase